MAFNFIGEFFDIVGIENIFLLITFLLSFALINFPMSRVFNKSPSTGPIIALLMALGVTAGVYYSGFDIEGLLFNMGFEMDLIIPIVTLLIVLGVFYLLWKIKFGKTLIVLGILMIILSFFAYERTMVLTVGIVLFLFGVILWLWSKKKLRNPGLDNPTSNNTPLTEKEKYEQVVYAEENRKLRQMEEKRQRNAQILQKQYNQLKKEFFSLRKKGSSPQLDEVIRKMKVINHAARKQGIRLS